MSETASKFNPETIKVGDGVTYGVGSDRYAATITAVSKSGKTVSFTDDEYKAAEGSEYYGNQSYVYTSVEPYSSVDPMGQERTNVRQARWNEKAQAFKYFGRVLSPGRHAYSDPSF